MAWTPKVNGEVIDASHINALQTGKVDSDGTASPTFVAATIDRIYSGPTHVIRIGELAGEGYVTGPGNINSTYVGNLAGRNVTTGHVCAFGQEAATGCTSGVVDAFGDGAALRTTTGTCCAFGHGTADGNTTGNVCAFGYHALFLSQAVIGACAFGYEAAVTANGGQCSAFGYQALHALTTGNACAFGYGAGGKTTTAHICAFGYLAANANVTRPLTAMGYYALNLKTADNGTAVGSQAAQNNVDGNITAIGHLAAYANTHGGVYLGHVAGAYETVGEKLFIDNMDRTNEANGRVRSLIYGTFNANPLLQTLWINGQFNILLGAVGAYANNAAAQAGGVPVGGVYRTNADPSVLCIRSA